MEYFKYGEQEIGYLKSRDPVLGQAIDRIGFIKREVHTELFAALVNSIVGQQISTKAQETVWRRIKDGLPHLFGCHSRKGGGVYRRRTSKLWDFFQESRVHKSCC